MAQDAERLAAQAERLSELKRFARVTFREIGDAIDVTERQVQRWFAGDGNISRDNLEKLATYLGTTPDFIEYGHREKGETPHPFSGQPVAVKLDEIMGALAGLKEQVRESTDELRRLQAELAVRDAEALARTGAAPAPTEHPRSRRQRSKPVAPPPSDAQ